MMGTVVSLIMLIIGSNVARAFALVGALSIIRFRNAMKETRDVGFIFLVMAMGMAVGTRFYLLAIFATAALSAFVRDAEPVQPVRQGDHRAHPAHPLPRRSRLRAAPSTPLSARTSTNTGSSRSKPCARACSKKSCYP